MNLRKSICFLIFILALPNRVDASYGSIWHWGENWFLDPLHGKESGEDVPVAVSGGFWRSDWEDKGIGIMSDSRGIYFLDIMLVVERYMPLFRISYGKFDIEVSQQGAEHRSSGSTRMEAEIGIAYRVLPTAALFGGWKVLRHSYTYPDHLSGTTIPGSGTILRTEPVFGGFQAGFIIAVPLGRRTVLYTRGNISSVSTEEEGYPRISGDQLEFGLALRSLGAPVSLRLGHRGSRFYGEERTEISSGKVVDERLSGVFVEVSYTFKTSPSAD